MMFFVDAKDADELLDEFAAITVERRQGERTIKINVPAVLVRTVQSWCIERNISFEESDDEVSDRTVFDGGNPERKRRPNYHANKW